jgi:hypothetical protein
MGGEQHRPRLGERARALREDPGDRGQISEPGYREPADRGNRGLSRPNGNVDRTLTGVGGYFRTHRTRYVLVDPGHLISHHVESGVPAMPTDEANRSRNRSAARSGTRASRHPPSESRLYPDTIDRRRHRNPDRGPWDDPSHQDRALDRFGEFRQVRLGGKGRISINPIGLKKDRSHDPSDTERAHPRPWITSRSSAAQAGLA